MADKIFFNGVNGATGTYDWSPLSVNELAAAIATSPKQAVPRKTPSFQVRMGHDPTNLADVGWGIVFANEDPLAQKIKEVLAPLLKLRQEQTNGKPGRYREYMGQSGYLAGQSTSDFLIAGGANPGLANPNNMPDHLLMVGDPRTLPFQFQYEMDVQYAVGRLHFDGRTEAEALAMYEQYARSVVSVESGQAKLKRQAALLGVQNVDDPATEFSSEYLISPLAHALKEGVPGWDIQSVSGPGRLNRDEIASYIGGDKTPALLFTASHGMAFPLDDSRQMRHQGALLGGEWSPRRPGPLSEQMYFSGDQLSERDRVLGLMAFHFACFGGGTPQHDDFSYQAGKPPAEIANRPFVAHLPQQLLSHRNGGALAVIAHIERAWGYSFAWGHSEEAWAHFSDALSALMRGYPVGHAMEAINARYAQLAAPLANELGNRYVADPRMTDEDFVRDWTASNDARGYLILGDPAVRLFISDEAPGAPSAASVRPTLASVVVTTKPDQLTQTNQTHLSGQSNQEENPMPNSTTATVQPGVNGAQGQSFVVPPDASELMKRDPELYKYWREHINQGFKNNNEMFSRVLNAFLGPYNHVVWMNIILFAIGSLSFIAAAILSYITQNSSFALIFGGLTVASFVGYFLSRPLRALEENLEVITWLGIIYNTYWTRLTMAGGSVKEQDDLLKQATDDAAKSIQELIAKHAELAGKRPGLQ